MPDGPGEWALDEKVIEGFQHLVAEDAAVVMRKAMPREAGGGPATVLACKPRKDPDPQRGPRAPDQFPVGHDGGASEHGSIVGIRSVDARVGPLPA